MNSRKIMAVVLAFAVLVSLSVPALAGVGGYAAPPRIPPAPATQEQINQATNAAAAGEQAVFVNISTITASALQGVLAQAPENAFVFVDTRVGNVITSRIFINAETAALLPETVNLAVHVDGAQPAPVATLFGRFFTNNIVVVSFEHQGAFGTYIRIAARVDLTNLNTESLVFYAYNRETNTYRLIEAPNYRIDAHGYLHFSTPFGGDIIITDRPLELR